MSISSNCLTHFTASKDALKGILSSNFKLKYCKETLILGAKEASFFVPMVSFCEIPLSQIKEHLDKYGSYGIGLTREWAVQNALNPVLYIEAKSHLALSLREAYVHYISDGIDTARLHLANLLRYSKNYQGDLRRGKKVFKNYRFSDEKEWRYVPDPSNGEGFIRISLKGKKKVVENEKASKIQLNFAPEDIKYIFIKSDSEITEFIRHLDDAKGANYSKREVERLTTRIITTEQLTKDL